MHHEHQAQADVRHHDKAAELEDVVQVRAGDHLGHQRQHAIRGELHHQAHQAHHPGLQGVDGGQGAIALVRVILEQLQGSHAKEHGKDHHADDRRRFGPSQIADWVARNERQQQLRDIQVSDLAHVITLDCLHPRGFGGAGHQALGGQAEQVGQGNADQCGDGCGEQQGANGQEADLAQ
ncbi:hypothetical protein D3C80_1282190 [compost metagenome]